MREKKKTILGIAVIIGLLGIITVGGLGFARTIMPKWRLTKGFFNLGKELTEYYNPVLAEAKFDQLWQKLQNGATHTVAEMDVSLPGKKVSTLGLKLDKSTDRQKRLLKTKGEISLFGKDGLDLEVAMAGEDLYLTLPALSSKALKLDADSLVSGFNDSLLAKLTGWNIPEDYLEFIFGDFLAQDGEAEASDNVRKLLAGAFLAGSMGQEKVVPNTEADVRKFLSQVEVTALQDRYTLNLPGDAVNQLFAKLGQILGSDKTVRFQEQLLFDIYLDQDHRIVRINTPEALRDPESGVKVEFSLNLLGEERTVDTVTMTMYVTDESQAGAPKEAEVILRWKGMPEQRDTLAQGGSSGVLSLEWKPVGEDASWLDAGSLELCFDWDYSGKAFHVTGEQQKQGKKLACEMQGNLLDVLPGERVQVNVETLRVIREEKEICTVAGLLMLEPLSEEIVMPGESVSVGW